MSTSKQQRKGSQDAPISSREQRTAAPFSLNSAEGKAFQRMKDVDKPTQWTTHGEIGEEIDLDAINKQLRERGYKIQV